MLVPGGGGGLLSLVSVPGGEGVPGGGDNGYRTSSTVVR